MDCIIYGLVDPRDGSVRYIGQSIHGQKRAARHWRDAVNGVERNKHKASWILGLAADGLKYEVVVLQHVSVRTELDSAERYWIMHGRSCGWRLTNLCDGGGTKDPSPETRAKIGAASRSRPHPEWSRERRAAFELNKGAWLDSLKRRQVRPWTESRRVAYAAREAARVADGRKHHEPSSETRALWSKQRRGRKLSAEAVERLRESLRLACSTPEAKERLRRAGRARHKKAAA